MSSSGRQGSQYTGRLAQRNVSHTSILDNHFFFMPFHSLCLLIFGSVNPHPHTDFCLRIKAMKSRWSSSAPPPAVPHLPRVGGPRSEGTVPTQGLGPPPSSHGLVSWSLLLKCCPKCTFKTWTRLLSWVHPSVGRSLGRRAIQGVTVYKRDTDSLSIWGQGCKHAII